MFRAGCGGESWRVRRVRLEIFEKNEEDGWEPTKQEKSREEKKKERTSTKGNWKKRQQNLHSRAAETSMNSMKSVCQRPPPASLPKLPQQRFAVLSVAGPDVSYKINCSRQAVALHRCFPTVEAAQQWMRQFACSKECSSLVVVPLHHAVLITKEAKHLSNREYQQTRCGRVLAQMQALHAQATTARKAKELRELESELEAERERLKIAAVADLPQQVVGTAPSSDPAFSKQKQPPVPEAKDGGIINDDSATADGDDWWTEGSSRDKIPHVAPQQGLSMSTSTCSSSSPCRAAATAGPVGKSNPDWAATTIKDWKAPDVQLLSLSEYVKHAQASSDSGSGGGVAADDVPVSVSGAAITVAAPVADHHHGRGDNSQSQQQLQDEEAALFGTPPHLASLHQQVALVQVITRMERKELAEGILIVQGFFPTSEAAGEYARAFMEAQPENEFCPDLTTVRVDERVEMRYKRSLVGNIVFRKQNKEAQQLWDGKREHKIEVRKKADEQALFERRKEMVLERTRREQQLEQQQLAPPAEDDKSLPSSLPSSRHWADDVCFDETCSAPNHAATVSSCPSALNVNVQPPRSLPAAQGCEKTSLSALTLLKLAQHGAAKPWMPSEPEKTFSAHDFCSAARSLANVTGARGEKHQHGAETCREVAQSSAPLHGGDSAAMGGAPLSAVQ